MKDFNVVCIGGGPSNISTLVGLYHKPFFQKIMEDRGICIIEKNNYLGGGNIKHYDITANSLGKVFTEFFEEKDSDLSHFVKSSKPYIKLTENYYNNAPPLSIVGEYLDVQGEFIAEYLIKNNSHVYLETTATHIEKKDDKFIITMKKNNQIFKVSSKYILLNIGGVQKKLSLNSSLNIIDSQDFIMGKYDNYIKSKRQLKISIIGGSHSTFSSLSRLLIILGEEKFKDTHITVYSKRHPKLFYKDASDARRDGYEFSSDDVCSESGRINRYSGLRYHSFTMAKEIFNRKYSNIFFNYESSNPALDDVVINCTGYANKMTPFSENGRIINFKKNDDKKFYINENLNPIYSDGKVAENIFCFGIGSGLVTGNKFGGEKKYSGGIDGIWVYQHIIPDILSQNLESSVQL